MNLNKSDLKTLAVGLLILALIVVGLVFFSNRAEAAPSALIRCYVSKVSVVQRVATVTIKSNRPIHYGQTSLKASYFDRGMVQRWITQDAGYGATIRVTRPATNFREWGVFRTWHAGTQCRTYALGGPAAGFTKVGTVGKAVSYKVAPKPIVVDFSCAIGNPRNLSGGRKVISNTFRGKWSGRPFSFTVIYANRLTGKRTSVKTYAPVGRSIIIPKNNAFWSELREIRGAYAGKTCKPWYQTEI